MNADQPLIDRLEVLEARIDELYSIAATQASYTAEVRIRLEELGRADEWLSRLLAKMRADPGRE